MPESRRNSRSAAPVEKKSDLTRKRILDAAARVLSQNGYAGTKLTDIAELAEQRVSTLYYYFTSREELVLAVLLTGSEQVREHTEAAVRAALSSASACDRLLTVVEAHLRFILEISDYTEAAVRNGGQLPIHMRREVAKEQAKYGRFWQNVVDDAVLEANAPYETPAERRALRLLIIGSLNWSVEWWKESRVSVDLVVRTALSMTRGALGSK